MMRSLHTFLFRAVILSFGSLAPIASGFGQSGTMEPIIPEPVLLDLASGTEYDTEYAGEYGWEYRWSSEEDWTSVVFPSNPPDRAGRTEVWYRIKLPSVVFRDPRLYISSIDTGADIYLEGNLIYSRNVPTSEQLQKGTVPFRGWPWHLIVLPDDFGGRQLEFHVFSAYKDIGLWGDIRVGPAYSHILTIFHQDFFGLIVCIFSLIISIIFFIIFLLNRMRFSSLILAAITLLLSLRAIASLQLRQFVLNWPLFWEHVRIWSALLLPIFIIYLLRRIIGRKYWRFMKVVLIVYAAIFGFSLVSGISGLLPFPFLYAVCDVLAVTTITLFLPLIIMAGIKGNREARIIIFSLVGVAGFVIYGVLMGAGIIPWSSQNDNTVLFIFVIGLVAILVRRIVLMHRRLDTYARRVSLLNTDLEKVVAERTAELEQANRELKIASITDGLTGLYNRMYVESVLQQMVMEAVRYTRTLSIILFDIDDFKKLNDSYGHQFGDKVLRRIGTCVRETLRDSDVPCRYGGEEFLLILPEADLNDSTQAAERLRRKIDEVLWENGARVTISCGVAALTQEGPEELIHRADISMYRAKHLGKNRVCT